jgi:histidinol-phosphate aminotransferase
MQSTCSPQTSRRSFLRLAGLATALPILSEGHFAWAAMQQAAFPVPQDPTKAIFINANENPLGPCPAALAAIQKAAGSGGRYDPYNAYEELFSVFPKTLGVPANYLKVYAGSSDPLQFTVMAFTSKDKPYVTADPSYEAGMEAAKANGAPILKVPLTSTYAHDVKAMVAASPNAGVLYICNPNNPTGTLTPKEDILWALQHKPRGSILLIDEAYIHLSDAPNCLDLVTAHQDVIILRTFSKVYGMAGIRCGAAIGRPDLLAKLDAYGMNPLPTTGVMAATASLKDKDLVPTRRKIIADTRNSTFAWLTKNNYKFIPSVSNCFMIDTGRDGKKVIAEMAAQNVMIGRTWPIWPNYVRITVGTPAEMAGFQTAFADVMSKPA